MSNREEFITKSKAVHADKYDYSLVDYTNCTGKVVIVCPIHGKFSQSANNHAQGRGCPKCGVMSSRNSRKKSTAQFIEQAKQLHHGRYDYSRVLYKGNMEKITIVCKEHGEFLQRANHHLQKQGCPVCAGKSK